MEPISLKVKQPDPVALGFSEPSPIGLSVGGAAPPADYNSLFNKPSIEGHVLVGDSTIGEIGVGELTPQEIDRIIYG